ncbi:hypothetical protein CPB84DRAFT_1817666 [Gymnopilus junonius]|uniref:Uncharacterized protein n=1 Tax=Gymnopilus junonius TaxID=109634 RepID=A0A9P5NCG7_GYMJU|nr:hypothetical protein CPB84DRAFT_1817666 [Gymnopilus junonius]
MSTNHRKRKHRPAHRSQGGGRRDHKPVYEEKEEQFLSHHQTYLNQVAGPSSSDLGKNVQVHDPLQALYIQAYEADIVRGPSAEVAAESLEVVEYRLAKQTQEDGKEKVVAIGTVQSRLCLIQWGASDSSYGLVGRGRRELTTTIPTTADEDDKTSIWVDRYDARLLLDTLPKYDNIPGPGPSSPTGWSDLPSDAEDTFFNPDEVEDFRKEKRRRLLDQTRERLRARMEEDGDDAEEELKEKEDIWGGSDEEPDDLQNELMKRTATHIVSSPNAAQLEMRILANHGGDRRFSFLRGRWSRQKEEKEIAESKKTAGLGVLTGYGSDDSGSASGSEDGGAASGARNVSGSLGKSSEQATPDAQDHNSQGVDEEAAKEARRKRLKEWVEKRRATKDDDQ